MASFRYYKFHIVATRGPGPELYQQMCDFILRNGGEDIAWPGGTTASNPDGGVSSGQEASKLIDASTATKWIDISNHSYSVLVFDCGTATDVSGYRYVTGDDADNRDPVSWTFEGSDNGTDWTVLDTQSGATITTSRSTPTQAFDFEAGGTPALLVATQPSATVSGYQMSPAPVVQMTTDGATVNTGFTGNITVELIGGSGVLLGTLVVAAVLGEAVFDDLRPCEEGGTLRFSAADVADVDSDAFAVLSGSGSFILLGGGMQRVLKKGETGASKKTISLDVRDFAGDIFDADGERPRIKLAGGAWEDADNTIVGSADGNEYTLSDTEADAVTAGNVIRVALPATGEHLASPEAAFEVVAGEWSAAPPDKAEIAAAVRDDQIDMLLEGVSFPAGNGSMTLKKSDGTTVTIAVTRGAVSGGVLGLT